jgi:hypothetical protein
MITPLLQLYQQLSRFAFRFSGLRIGVASNGQKNQNGIEEFHERIICWINSLTSYRLQCFKFCGLASGTG